MTLNPNQDWPQETPNAGSTNLSLSRGGQGPRIQPVAVSVVGNGDFETHQTGPKLMIHLNSKPETLNPNLVTQSPNKTHPKQEARNLERPALMRVFFMVWRGSERCKDAGWVLKGLGNFVIRGFRFLGFWGLGHCSPYSMGPCGSSSGLGIGLRACFVGTARQPILGQPEFCWSLKYRLFLGNHLNLRPKRK